MSFHKPESPSFDCVAVPLKDIQDLEVARKHLIYMLEAAERLNINTLTSITSPMWRITHTKYKSISIQEGV